MAGLIYYNNGNSWRYENEGTTQGLKVSGTTVTGLASTKSKTGTAFWQTNRVSTFPIPATKELWVKFDLYYNNAQWRAYDRLNGNDTGIGIYHTSQGLIAYINGPTSYLLKPQNPFTTNNKLYTVLLHMVSDAENGLLECWVNGEKYYSEDYASEGLIYKGNVENGANFENFYLQTPNANNLFSNVIISNERIGLGENVINYGLTSVLDFDLQREITTWRYENYGTADLLTVAGTTVALNKNQSRYYSGFYQPQRIKCFDIPATKEIWIKCDINVVSNISSSRIRIYNAPNKNTVNGWSTYGGSLTTSYCYWVNGTSYDGGYRILRNDEGDGKQPFLLHMKSGVTDGFLEFYFLSKTNSTYRSFTGNVNNGNDFDNVFIQMDGTNIQVSDLIISSTEVRINEHCKMPLTVLSDTTRSLGKSYEILFDVERQILNASHDGVIALDFHLNRIISKQYEIDFDITREVNVWRYDNYGTADLLSVPGTTIALRKTQSLYYSGFQATASRQNYFGIPNTKEIWIKFDLYFGANYQTLFVGSLDGENPSQVRLNCCGTNSDYHRMIFTFGNRVVDDQSNQLYSQTLYRVLVHMKSDATNGKIELFLSDSYNLSYTGNVNDGNDFANVYIQASNYNSITTYPYVSNVIISNGEIRLDENCKMPLNNSFDAIRSIANAFTFEVAMLRDIANAFAFEVAMLRDIVLSQSFLLDTLRYLQNVLYIDVDVCRIVKMSLEINYDTVRTMPHSVMLSIIEQAGEITPGSGVPTTENDTGGLQSIEISIAEQELTDRVSFTGTLPMQIFDQIKGQYLDYEYNMRIESRHQQGALYTYNCCSDIDEILYKQLDYHIPATEIIYIDASGNEMSHINPQEEGVPIARASKHIIKIAETLGKQPVMQFDDFKSTVDIEAGGVTYNDLIRDIFGWTGRLPHKKINCYLRGDRLYVVQRGHEANVIDLTATDHTVPVVNEELIRTTWGSSIWSKNEVKSTFIGGQWFHTEYHPKETSQNNNKYEYDNDGLITYTRKEGKEQGSFTETHYYYDTLENGKKILTKEETEIWEGNSVVDRQTVWHEYLDQGQTHVMAENEDGDYLGSVVGQSKGDDRPRKSPFDSQDYWTAVYKPGKQQRTLYGLSLIDTSFPVYGDDKLEEITQAIIQLNRKIQETITFDVYNYNHIIDFNDRILFNGNAYHLVNNTAVKTPRIVNKQTVSFVRWLL